MRERRERKNCGRERGRKVRKGRLDGWIHGCMGECVDRSMNGWMDEQIKMNK